MSSSVAPRLDGAGRQMAANTRRHNVGFKSAASPQESGVCSRLQASGRWSTSNERAYFDTEGREPAKEPPTRTTQRLIEENTYPPTNEQQSFMSGGSMPKLILKKPESASESVSEGFRFGRAPKKIFELTRSATNHEHPKPKENEPSTEVLDGSRTKQTIEDPVTSWPTVPPAGKLEARSSSRTRSRAPNGICSVLPATGFAEADRVHAADTDENTRHLESSVCSDEQLSCFHDYASGKFDNFDSSRATKDLKTEFLGPTEPPLSKLACNKLSNPESERPSPARETAQSHLHQPSTGMLTDGLNAETTAKDPADSSGAGSDDILDIFHPRSQQEQSQAAIQQRKTQAKPNTANWLQPQSRVHEADLTNADSSTQDRSDIASTARLRGPSFSSRRPCQAIVCNEAQHEADRKSPEVIEIKEDIIDDNNELRPISTEPRDQGFLKRPTKPRWSSASLQARRKEGQRSKTPGNDNAISCDGRRSTIGRQERTQQYQERILRQLSPKYGPVRVTKSPRPNRDALESMQSAEFLGTVNSQSFLDLTQGMTNAFAENEEKRWQLEAMNEEYSAEIGRLKQEAENRTVELGNVREENESLKETVGDQEKRVTKIQERASSMQKFTKGLGTDFNRLNGTGITFKHQLADLKEEGKQLRQECDDRQREIHTRIEESKRLNQRLQEIVKDACFKVDLLEREKVSLKLELDGKIAALEEARDRQNQLQENMAKMKEMQENVDRMLKANHESAIRKIEELAEKLLQDQTKDTTQNNISECVSLLKSIGTSKIAKPEDLLKVEALIQSTSDTLSDKIEGIQQEFPDLLNLTGDLQTRLTENIDNLKSELVSCDELRKQIVTLRDGISTLEEQIASKNGTISELEHQRDDAQKSEASAIGRLTRLEEELCAMKANLATTEKDAQHIREIEHQNTDLLNCLECTKKEVTNTKERLTESAVIEKHLGSEMNRLKVLLVEANDRNANFEAEKSEIQRKSQLELIEMRNKLTKEANKLKLEQEAEHKNKMHQITQKNAQLEVSLETANEEVRSTKAILEQLKGKFGAQDVDIQYLKTAKPQGKELGAFQTKRGVDQAGIVAAEARSQVSEMLCERSCPTPGQDSRNSHSHCPPNHVSIGHTSSSWIPLNTKNARGSQSTGIARQQKTSNVKGSSHISYLLGRNTIPAESLENDLVEASISGKSNNAARTIGAEVEETANKSALNEGLEGITPFINCGQQLHGNDLARQQSETSSLSDLIEISSPKESSDLAVDKISPGGTSRDTRAKAEEASVHTSRALEDVSSGKTYRTQAYPNTASKMAPKTALKSALRDTSSTTDKIGPVEDSGIPERNQTGQRSVSFCATEKNSEDGRLYEPNVSESSEDGLSTKGQYQTQQHTLTAPENMCLRNGKVRPTLFTSLPKTAGIRRKAPKDQGQPRKAKRPKGLTSDESRPSVSSAPDLALKSASSAVTGLSNLRMKTSKQQPTPSSSRAKHAQHRNSQAKYDDRFGTQK